MLRNTALVTESSDQALTELLALVHLETAAAIRGALRDSESLPPEHPLRMLHSDTWTPSEWAEQIGLTLRASGYSRSICNEFFRAAFYRSDAPFKLSSNPLYALFLANKAIAPLDKWVHYFEIYEHHFARFREKQPRILEIGVFRGGGLHLLQQYFAPGTYLVGADIDESAARACHGRFALEIGDQSDPNFLNEVLQRHGPFDIIIDDGGHSMKQQIVSFETLFESVNPGGIYLIEDCHTSYWPEFQDHPITLMDFAKARTDDVNGFHQENPDGEPKWTRVIGGIHFYDSVVVFDRVDRKPPFCEISGLATGLKSQRDNDLQTVNLQTMVNDLMAASEWHSARASVLDSEKEALLAEQRRLLDAVTHLEESLDTRDADLMSIQASTTWRATRPLRWLKSRGK